MNKSVQKTLSLLMGFGCLVNLGLYVAQTQNAQANTGNVFMATYQPGEKLKATIEYTDVQNPQHAIQVPFAKDSKSLMLDATVDNQQTGRFILDTGATYTTISREMATELGYDLTNTPKVNITTANGTISIPKIKIKALTLNGYTAYNVDATVMQMPKNVPFNGLLGLSFVKRHKITIDSAASKLVIEPQA